MNSYYIHSEPNQFNNDCIRSSTSYDNKLSGIMYQLISSVLSVLLCLADSLHCFYTLVASTYLFERNFQLERRGGQPNARGRGRWKNPTPIIFLKFPFFCLFLTFLFYPTPTISQVFPFFYFHPSSTIYQFFTKFSNISFLSTIFPKFPFSFLNLFFSNSRIFSKMRIIHFKNIFSVNFRDLKDRFKMLVLAYDYNKEEIDLMIVNVYRGESEFLGVFCDTPGSITLLPLAQGNDMTLLGVS